MAPVTIPNGLGRVQVYYAYSGVSYNSAVYVKAVDDGGTYKVSNQDGSSKKAVNDFVSDVMGPLFKAMIHTSSSIYWTNFYTYLDGAWIFRASATLNITGTGALTPVPTAALTMTFRDEDYQFVRQMVFMPALNVSPASSKHGNAWQAVVDWQAALIAGTASGTNLGSYVRSRGDQYIRNTLNWSVKNNDRLHRAAGYT